MLFRMLVMMNLIFILSCIAGEEEKLVKEFIEALITRNAKEMQKRITFVDEDEAKYLWKLEKHKPHELKMLMKELKKAKVEWKKAGDLIKLHRGRIRVNQNMIDDRHKVATCRLRGYGTPIQLVKQGKTWRVNPRLLIVANRIKFRIQANKNRANYRLKVGDKYIELNEKQIKEIEINGQKVKLELTKNESQFYKTDNYSFSYHHQMQPFTEIDGSTETITVASRVGKLNCVIQYYPKNMTGTKGEEMMYNVVAEGYTKIKGEVIKGTKKDITRNINGKAVVGKQWEVRIGNKLFQDEVYSITKDGKVIILFFHSLQSDAAVAKNFFSIIAKSLKFETKE